jgi:hypothetical protein
MKPSDRIAALTHEFKNLEPASRWARATILYLDEQHAAGHQRERECSGLIGMKSSGGVVRISAKKRYPRVPPEHQPFSHGRLR